MGQFDYQVFNITFDSNYYDEGSLYEPIYYIKPEISNIVGMQFIGGTVQFTYYVFDTPYNTFKFQPFGSSFADCTIDPGNYDSNTIGAAIKDALTDSTIGSDYGLTIVIDEETQKLYLIDNGVPAGNFSIQFGTKSAALELGFDNNTTYTSTSGTITVNGVTYTARRYIVSPYVVNLTGPNYIYIHSDRLAQTYEGVYRTGAYATDIVGRIPVTTNPGGNIVFIEQSPMDVPVNIHSLNNVKFYLTLGNRTEILNLNGGTFQVDIRVFKYNNQLTNLNTDEYGQSHLSVHGGNDRSNQGSMVRKRGRFM